MTRDKHLSCLSDRNETIVDGEKFFFIEIVQLMS